eukprot:gb/GECG01013106.1/.p1 GENE.gb/GECG01013106.1/~~gb/GECG01013106.1/.p1  ORF type:complete len:298 (+),score=30.17 gb/GECG01013106.1/:1-894(+)
MLGVRQLQQLSRVGGRCGVFPTQYGRTIGMPPCHLPRKCPSGRRVFHRSCQKRKAEQDKPKQDTLDDSQGFEHSTPQQQWMWRISLGAFIGATTYIAFRFWQDIFSSKAQNQALEDVKNIPLVKSNPVVYMDVEADGEDLGRIVIQLRRDVVPRTTENYRALFTNELGFGLKGCRFHMLLPSNYVVTGDFENGDGTGGHCIYKNDQGKFDSFGAENFKLKHLGPGIVSSVAPDKTSHSSHFMITLSRAPLLDGKYVAFGNVVEGFDVLEKLQQKGDWKGFPKSEVRIKDCGELILSN